MKGNPDPHVKPSSSLSEEDTVTYIMGWRADTDGIPIPHLLTTVLVCFCGYFWIPFTLWLSEELIRLFSHLLLIQPTPSHLIFPSNQF